MMVYETSMQVSDLVPINIVSCGVLMPTSLVMVDDLDFIHARLMLLVGQ